MKVVSNISRSRSVTWLFLLGIALLVVSCNGGTIIEGDGAKPLITFRNQSHVYKVKVGRDTTLRPEILRGEGARFVWSLDSGDGQWRVVGDEPTYTFSTDGLAAGDQCFLKLKVTNSHGSSEDEVRMDVVALAPPVVSFGVAAGGIDVVQGREYVIEPEVTADGATTYEWKMDGQTVGTEATYTFTGDELGSHTLELTATNEDGTGSGSVEVNVVESIPVTARFLPAYGGVDGSTRYIPAGRTIYLKPFVSGASNPSYSWTVGGEPVAETSGLFAFTPASEGSYEVAVSVADEDPSQALRLSPSLRQTGRSATVATVTVVCVGQDHKRQPGPSSAARWSSIMEYLPAPGQFIGEPLSGYNNETTMEQACAYAEARLTAGRFVSLGGFGGYIIAAFDHSILRRGSLAGPASAGDCDFSVSGNQFDGGSEPGIVWVMQDTNGNGLPDDEWYELRSSETGKATTWNDYAVTYYRPPAARTNVAWKDNRGNKGSVDILSFHTQNSYYPSWVEGDSYTLYGTRVKSTTYYDASLYKWVHGALGWGYVDNAGSDSQAGSLPAGSDPDTAAACKTYFKIANAINAAGEPAGLDYIDFIKVQNAVNAKAAVIGECSTEVLDVRDEGLGR